MQDYSKLVEALRCEELKGIACPDCYERECIANSGKGLYCRVPQLLEDAAAAIEALQATIELMKPYIPDFFPDANKVTLPKMEVQE